MILYHGTVSKNAISIIENGIDLSVCQIHTDFAQGFYLTPDRYQAIRWAERKTAAAKTWFKYPVVLSYSVDSKIFTSLHTKIFKTTNIEWAQFIINNRCGMDYALGGEYHDQNIDKKYDVVIGYIADGQITDLAKQLEKENREVSENELIKIINPHYPKQYSFHTQRALEILGNARYNKIQKGELKYVQK